MVTDDTLPPPPDAPLAAGTRVGEWIVERHIAAGGFGTVYAARHAERDEKAAVKVLHPELAAWPEAIERFRREVRAASLLRHPALVELRGLGELDGRPYFAMELLDGRDLAEHLAAVGRLPVAEALAVLAPVCDALAVAHASGIVHRDVKPSNVFLAKGGRVVLLDFGVAKLLGGGGMSLTTSRQLVGTPMYMAPEQITDGPIDARTDVYAVGALAYTMLAGEPPFADHSPTVMQYLHLHARRPRVSVRAGVPGALDEVLARAMSVRPEERPAGARELYAALLAATGAEIERRAWAVAVHIDVRADAGALEEPDDALLHDVEEVLPRAIAHFRERGFVPALVTGTSAVVARALADDEPAARRETLAAALALCELLAARPGRDPRVHVGLAVHVDAAVLVGGAVKGGPLLKLAAWVPEADHEGVVASGAALAGVEAVTEEVVDAPGVRRVLRCR